MGDRISSGSGREGVNTTTPADTNVGTPSYGWERSVPLSTVSRLTNVWLYGGVLKRLINNLEN